MIACLTTSIHASVCLAQTNDGPLVQIDAKDLGETDRMAKAIEIRKNREHFQNPSEARQQQFRGREHVRARVLEVKARHSEYFINLKEWQDKDGSRNYIAGFTNKKNADVKKEFSAQYTDKDKGAKSEST
ncbi:MAG TPA: hypothetical protein VGF13_19115 [Verrucomicrobiae bacterium]